MKFISIFHSLVKIFAMQQFHMYKKTMDVSFERYLNYSFINNEPFEPVYVYNLRHMNYIHNYKLKDVYDPLLYDDHLFLHFMMGMFV